MHSNEEVRAEKEAPRTLVVPSPPSLERGAHGDGGAVGTQLRFHLVFAFLGIFSAEAISANFPAAPLFPLIYPIYGGLYLFFVDSLLRRRVSSWTTVYLYGVLVGYVTESFAAKVMWFGWPDNTVNFLGVLPWPELPLLAFFFHPLFAFMIPVYLARRYLDFPFALPTSPRVDRVLPWLWPAFAVLQVRFCGLDAARHCLAFTLDALVFCFLLGRLRLRAPCEDLRLTPRARGLCGLLVLGSYLFFLLKLPPFNRQVVMLPSAFQLGFAILFTLLLLRMVWTRIRHLPDQGPVAYDPGSLPIEGKRRYALYLVGSQVAGLALLQVIPLGPVKVGWALIFVTGTLGGTFFFLRELWRTRWRSSGSWTGRGPRS